jgi:hypothetical protein
MKSSSDTVGPRWVGHIHGYEMLGRHGWAQVGGVYTWVHLGMRSSADTVGPRWVDNIHEYQNLGRHLSAQVGHQGIGESLV